MKNYIADSIRRTEILARVINGEQLSRLDYALEYNVSEITISRDIAYLRESGINIYSKQAAIVTGNAPDISLISDFIANYIPLKLNESLFKENFEAIEKIKDNNYFINLVLLAKAVTDKFVIKITYERLSDSSIQKYTLQPVKLYHSDYNWIMQAVKKDEDILKTFYVSRIKSIEFTKSQHKLGSEVKQQQKRLHLKLKFSQEVSNELLGKIWFDEFTQYEQDGSIILETKQPISIKLASWCISWWDKLEIIEPQELKDYIKEMIDSFTGSV